MTLNIAKIPLPINHTLKDNGCPAFPVDVSLPHVIWWDGQGNMGTVNGTNNLWNAMAALEGGDNVVPMFMPIHGRKPEAAGACSSISQVSRILPQIAKAKTYCVSNEPWTIKIFCSSKLWV